MRCSVFIKESHDKHMKRISLPSHQPAHGYPSNTCGDPPVPLFPSLRTVLNSLLICYGSITATLMCTISLSPVYRPALTMRVIDFGHVTVLFRIFRVALAIQETSLSLSKPLINMATGGTVHAKRDFVRTLPPSLDRSLLNSASCYHPVSQSPAAFIFTASPTSLSA
jgi:hypothetical protein